MKILFLTQWFDPEPGAIHGLPLATWMARRGHQVQVITGFPNYPTGQFYPGYPLRLTRREEVEDVSILRLPLYPSRDRSALRRTLNYTSFALSSTAIGSWATGGADIAYVYHPPATVSLAAMLWKRLRSIPFVYHIADMWPDSVTESGMIGSRRMADAVGRAIAAWCDRTYREASAITVLSPGFKDMLVERGVPSEKVHSIYNWTDETKFFPREADPDLAEKFGFSGYFNMVYAGNLGPFQNLDVAIRAAAQVRDLDRFRLVIVGTGQEEERLRRLVDELGVQNVRFLGRVDNREISGINALADAFLVSLKDLPFFRSTIPGKTQVALACGRPILLAVAGDAAAMVEAAGAGETCRPDDVDALAVGFRKMYGLEPAVLRAMGARGRSYYEKELSLDIGAARLESILQGVVRQGR